MKLPYKKSDFLQRKRIYGVVIISESGEGRNNESNLASFDGTARRFDIQTGVSDVCFQHPEGVKAVYPTENNQLVITGCRDENVRVWDVAVGL